MRLQMPTAVVVLLAMSAASHAATFDQLVGAVTPAGDAYLIKHFRVSRGSVVAGVQFYSNDLRTTFPEVAVFRGPASKLSDATALVQLANVRPIGRHLAVAACTPQRIPSDQDIYVAIRLPVSDGIRSLGDGAGIAARRSSGPPTSYFATGRDGAFGAMDVDYGIELVFQTVGKTDAASMPEPVDQVHRTFFQVENPSAASGATKIDFGLEKTAGASLVIYDSAGRRVRSLVHETLPAGEYSRSWDGRGDQGQEVAAGVYFAKFQAGEKAFTEKIVVVK